MTLAPPDDRALPTAHDHGALPSGIAVQALARSRQPVLYADGAFRILWCNDAAVALAGAQRADLLGMRLGQFAAGSRLLGDPEDVARLRRGEGIVTEVVVRHGDAAPRYLDAEVSPAEGGFLVVCIDVTEHRHFEREAKFLHVEMDRANEALYHTDDLGRIVHVNDAAVRMLGYPREQLLGQHASMLHDDQAQPDWAAVRTELDAGRSLTIESFHRTRDGRALPVEVRVSNVTIDGETRRSALVRDISERHRAAEAQASANLKLRAILDAVADIVIVHDAAGRVIDCNARAEALLSLSPGGRNAFDIWQLPGEFAAPAGLREHVLGLPPRQPFVGRREFGTGADAVVIDLRTERIDLPDGASVWVLTTRDVSEQHRQQQALEASRALLRQIIDVLPQGVYWKDRELRYLGANTTYLRDVGVPELVGRSDAELDLPAEAIARYRAQDMDVLTAGEPEVNVVESGVRRDGSAWWISYTKRPLRDADGAIIGVIGAYTDITAIRAGEQALAFRVALAETVSRLHASYVQATGTDALMQDMLAELLALTGSARGFIADPHTSRNANLLGTHRLWLRAQREDQPGVTAMREVTEWHAEALHGLARMCTQRGGLVVCNGPDDGLPLPPTVSNYLAVDLRQGEELLCCLGFADRPSGFDDGLVQALQPVFGTVAQLIAAWRTRLEREAAERALLEAKERAERAVRAKSMFLATMSHEIRTPLNAILGMTELMLDDEHEEARRAQLQVVMQSGNGLLTIINDVLDFSKVEAGELRFESNVFDVRRKCADMRDLCAVEARRKGLALDVDVASSVPAWLLGDAGRIGQVLVNLLNNAIKFTEHGRVTLLVSGAMRQDGRFGIVFSVTDTGIGIEPGVQDALFEPFTQADASMSRRFGGTGLGLAICRRLVHAMHGEIGMQSVPGHGSVFWFTLALDVAQPVAEAAQAQPVTATGVVARDDDRGLPRPSLRVLVAEDNSVNQRVVTSMLRKLGCAVDVAANGFEAIDMFGRFPYDLVLMDWQMPELDGIEATRAIRALPEGVQVPIVALTANAMHGDEATCLAAGMDDYLTKPIRIAALRDVLERWTTDAARAPRRGQRGSPGEIASGT
jgi:PAS domain S-box-containing protein